MNPLDLSGLLNNRMFDSNNIYENAFKLAQNPNWIAIQTITTIVTLFILLFQLSSLKNQILLQNNSHIVELMRSLNERWNSMIMLYCRITLCNSVKKGADPFKNGSADFIATFYEELGLFQHKRIANQEIIWEIFSDDIVHYWKVMENYIISNRQELGPALYTHFQNLNLKILQIEEAKNIHYQNINNVEYIKSYFANEYKNCRRLYSSISNN